MSNQPINPLRRRMIEDMTIRRLSPTTQSAYLRVIRSFANFLGRSPNRACADDLRRYQLHLTAIGASAPSVNVAVAALRFFFKVTLGRNDATDHIPFVREPDRLPVVLSQEEVACLLEATPSLKYKAALSLAYAAGLRVSEITALKIEDIDSARMVIRVEQGKGRKDRYVMLSPHLLELLRAWWKMARPRGWLFPGPDRVQPLSARALNRACHVAARQAGIDKRVSMHTLRHSFATHLLEQKTDVRIIQALLGHRRLNTTMLYTRVAIKTIGEVTSPLELLPREMTPPA